MRGRQLKFRGRPLTLHRVKEFIIRPIDKVKWKLYVKYYIPYKANKIREQKEIRVLFVLAELGSWKTEELYIRMLAHDRFQPILGVTTSQEVPGSKTNLIKYIESRGYNYVDLDTGNNVIGSLKADVIFYYKPYSNSYPSNMYYDHHLKPLVCHINYTFNLGCDKTALGHMITNHAWFNFVENKAVERTRVGIGLYSKNVRVTGCPAQDILMRDKSCFNNPWKYNGRKKIIYSPHHSIPGTNGDFIEYSTFLTFGEYMLEMAKKFRDSTQWAFKPHPTLYPKLLKIWGKERTDSYYNSWSDLENAQVELGEYAGLFKHSDAMIHDCSSFIAEYQYTHNPVMFLMLDEKQKSFQGEFGQKAFEAHYLGKSTKDIENFIIDIINNRDYMQDVRDKFVKDYLTPPNGISACDNIINTILGNDSPKN